MQELHVFDGLSENELQKMMVCFQAQIKEYNADEKLAFYKENKNRIGVILEGEADLIKYDQDGYRNIIEHLREQDIFGKMFFSPYDDNDVDIVTCRRCKIIFFDYHQDYFFDLFICCESSVA